MLDTHKSEKKRKKDSRDRILKMHNAVRGREGRFEDSRRLSIMCLIAITYLSSLLFVALSHVQIFTHPIIIAFIALVAWPSIKLSFPSNKKELYPGFKAQAAVYCAVLLKGLLMMSIFMMSYAMDATMARFGEEWFATLYGVSYPTALLIIISLVGAFLVISAMEALFAWACKGAAQQIYASDLKREWGVDNASSFEGILRAVKDGGFNLGDRIEIIDRVWGKLDEIASKLSEGGKTPEDCNKIEKDFLKSCEQLINDSRSFSSVIEGIDERSKLLLDNSDEKTPSLISRLQNLRSSASLERKDSKVTSIPRQRLGDLDPSVVFEGGKDSIQMAALQKHGQQFSAPSC